MKPPYHKVRSYFICCLALLISSVPCFAQRNFIFPPVEYISTKNGLSNNSTFCVLQDHRGFIWIATYDGLDRYDGYNFKVYNYNPTDTNTLSPGWYKSMAEDKNGIIWMTGASQGFYSFDPVKEKFVHYYYQPGNSNSLAGDIGDRNLIIDSSGLIWLSTSAGLNSFDPVKRKFELYTHHENDNSTLSASNIVWVCTDDENNIWVITAANTLDVFNISTKKVTAHYTIGSVEMPGNKSKPGLYSISKGANDNIWIGSEYNGLYGYNTKTKNWKHFIPDRGRKFSLQHDGINVCLEDNAGNLWIAPIGDGIYYYEVASGKFYYSDKPKTEINSFIRDKSGKIWLTCDDIGLFTYDPINKKIAIVRNDAEKKDLLRSNFIVGFYPAGPNEFYFNGMNGVYRFNTVTKNISPFKILENGKDIFDGNANWMVRQDSKGIFWICTVNGLVTYDPQNKTHHFYRHIENDTTSLSAQPNSFVEDNNGKIWISTFGGGLDLLDRNTGKFKAFKAHSGKNSIGTNFIQGMIKDSRGMIYIGSWSGGLIQFNPATEIFKVFTHRPSNPNSISGDITWPLLEDKNGFIWVGTVGGGLNVFDPSTERFRAFTMNDGLPSNAVVSMINDNDGNTWIGTYHGLSLCKLPKDPFDKSSKISFRNYDTSDGLPSNDMYFWGCHKEPDGTLYFSTNNEGFFYFNPHDLKDNDLIPSVNITGFALMNKPVNADDSGSILKLPIEFTKEIKLSYKQNIISFSFAALNYIHPEKNKYAYMLEGYDKDWIITDASKRFANYTNLDPRKYVFKVKATNNDGKWNETPTELTVIITPPFWKTIWFRFLAVFLAFSLLYAFYRYRIGQILLLQRIRNRIAADLHDDIGSTLNSISVFSEVAKKDNAKREHALAMIGESSRKIVESMSDIVWSINPENDSFDKIIFRMRSFSYNLLKLKKIECSFSVDESLSGIKLPMEKRRNFYLIFKESINNLVKYSQAQHASILISREHAGITCLIRDDGIGFDTTKEYIGNGLSNMRKRAKDIDAGLSIESITGQGTTVELNLKT